ncbi:Modification methylase ScrFIA, partial [Durusdinium trenchii]
VFNLLKGHEVACRGARHLTLLGHTVCNRGFMRLVGIGKSRFRTISKAINEGLVRCPMDARFLPKEPKPQSPKRQAVWDYLWALYEQAAERLPDGNTLHSNKRPRQGAFKYDHPSMSRDEVWMQDFQHRLRLRQQSHHARCSICVRHRLIIRRLGRGPARLAQLGEYRGHLARQYRDRQVYWGHRAKSRTEAISGGSVTHISMICDGMDQAKHAYPKGDALNAKEFSSWAQPRLQATTIIAHGHAILLKHQTGLRMMSSLIALHRLRGCEFSYLSTGHSHEDIDAHFSLTSSYLDRFRELHTINDFQNTLQTMKGHFAHYLHGLHLKGIGGLDRKCLISKFWRRRHAAEGPNDVVLSTKRFMSDESYQPKVFLYLPASEALRLEHAPPPPGLARLSMDVPNACFPSKVWMGIHIGFYF